MQLFNDILMNVTLPIVALVGLGFGAQKRLKIDVPSLNRLLVFVIMPAFLVHFLASANQTIGDLWPTIYFTAIQFVALMAMGWFAARLFRLPPEFAPVFAMATVYANVGNYGLPLVKLAFPESFILHQSVITSMMTMLMVTVGVWMLAPKREDSSLLGRLKVAFETPVIPAVILGLALRAAEVRLPSIVGLPLELIGSTFPPLALFALGAQLADTGRTAIKAGPMSIMMVLKLVLAPALTWGLALLLGMPDDLTDLYVVAAATPVGILLALFCAEYDRHPKFVSSAVLISTLLSPIFVTGWILLTRMI
ncbi:MAG: AEC family transporter [Hyphomicrobiaceae bacterium]